jgi:hypothetical protein
MDKHIGIYPILGVTPEYLDDPFDLSQLPVEILPGVTVENTKALFKADSFDTWKGLLAQREFEALQRVRFGIVNRYDPFDLALGSSSETDIQAEAVARYLAGCLRLIRPMQQDASYIRGTILSDSTVRIQGFENPEDMQVLSVQRLFLLRNRDVDRLKRVGPLFVDIMKAKKCWKVIVAAELHESSHFVWRSWKARFSLLCSAIEAIFTSQNGEHRGSLVAMERIKSFLGAKTLIYEPGDMQSTQQQITTTVEDVLSDLYELRNCVAHGDRVPAKFFETVRHDYDQTVVRAEMLSEAASRIVRSSLLQIVEQGMQHHFLDSQTSETFFGGQDLTRSALLKKKKGTP